MRLFILLLLFRNVVFHEYKSNYCPANEDYVRLDKRECYYNPSIGANVMEMITNNGYQYRIYEAITSDGYILNFFRIFKSADNFGGNVIYFQHGLLSDSGNFLADGKSSLAFQLAEHGYDVFLGNSRGTPYSRNHIHPKITHEEYWNYSFEEMAIFDVPATLQKISEITNSQEIVYIGHSMGGAISAIYATQKKEHAKKCIKAFVNIAPVIYFENYESPLQYLAQYLSVFQSIMNYFDIQAFNDKKFLQPFLITLCSRYPTVILCTKLMESSLGDSDISRRSDIVPLLASQLSSSAFKPIYHYLQILRNNGKFTRYDYGRRKNYMIYKDFKPPEYNFSNIDLPMYIFYSDHDLLAKEQSVRKFYNTISSMEKRMIKIPEEDGIIFNHHDFLNSEYVKEIFHKPFFELLKSIYE